MPSEQQLQKALQEQRDLERELQLLNEACDAKESVQRIMDFIANTPEGLVDPENTLPNGPGSYVARSCDNYGEYLRTILLLLSGSVE